MKSERRHNSSRSTLVALRPGDGLFVEERIVGQHRHVEHRRAQLGEAAADVAQADDADRLVVDVVAHVEVAVLHGAVAERIVDLHHLLRQHQHHAEHVGRHRVGVAAGLVDDEDAGIGAVLDVHGVVAGAAGRDDQEVRRPRDQALVDVVLRRQLIARRADLVGMGRRHDRVGDRIGRIVLQLVEPDFRTGGDQVEIDRMVEEAYVEHPLYVLFRCRTVNHHATPIVCKTPGAIFAIAALSRPAACNAEIASLIEGLPRVRRAGRNLRYFCFLELATPRRYQNTHVGEGRCILLRPYWRSPRWAFPRPVRWQAHTTH